LPVLLKQKDSKPMQRDAQGHSALDLAILKTKPIENLDSILILLEANLPLSLKKMNDKRTNLSPKEKLIKAIENTYKPSLFMRFFRALINFVLRKQKVEAPDLLAKAFLDEAKPEYTLILLKAGISIAHLAAENKDKVLARLEAMVANPSEPLKAYPNLLDNIKIELANHYFKTALNQNSVEFNSSHLAMARDYIGAVQAQSNPFVKNLKASIAEVLAELEQSELEAKQMAEQEAADAALGAAPSILTKSNSLRLDPESTGLLKKEDKSLDDAIKPGKGTKK
jgi:hypothetical protein